MYVKVFFKIIFPAVVGKVFVRIICQRYLSCYLNISLENILRQLLLKIIVFKRKTRFFVRQNRCEVLIMRQRHCYAACFAVVYLLLVKLVETLDKVCITVLKKVDSFECE